MQFALGAQAWVKSIYFRWCLGIWILFCLIIGVAFNGNLRSFLITPEYSNPIETLEDVVNSGFSIGYMPSGTIVSLGT